MTLKQSIARLIIRKTAKYVFLFGLSLVFVSLFSLPLPKTTWLGWISAPALYVGIFLALYSAVTILLSSKSFSHGMRYIGRAMLLAGTIGLLLPTIAKMKLDTRLEFAVEYLSKTAPKVYILAICYTVIGLLIIVLFKERKK